MQTGSIVWFNMSKGYGFILPDDTPEQVWMHVNDLAEGDEAQLVPQARVSFEIASSRKGPKAVQVCILGASSAAEPFEEPQEDQPSNYAAFRETVYELADKHVKAFAEELLSLLGV